MQLIQTILQALNDSSSYMLTNKERDHLKKEKERQEEQSDENIQKDNWAEKMKEKEKECKKWKMND